MKTLRTSLSLLLAAVLVAACSSPSFKEEPSGEFAAEGLYPVRSTGFREVHARRDAQLASYSAVMIEAMNAADVHIVTTGGSGTLGRDWQMTPEREQALQARWAAAAGRAFSAYEQSSDGEQVLRITSALTRVVQGMTSFTGGTAAGGSPGGSSASADIHVEFRLYDQASGRLLAVIRDDRSIPAQQWSRTAGAGIVSVFDSWAALLHTRVSGR